LWLGRPAITDSDEAYYAEAAREMVESGNWVTPYFNYEPRFEKPILYYWLAGSAYVAAGVSETAARFWSALSGVGLCLVTWACARRWCGEQIGLLAGTILATSLGIFAIARYSLPDLPLTFFVTVGTWMLIDALDRGASARVRRRRLLAASASLALGMLAKGPIALALPAAVLVSLVLWRWRATGDALSFPTLADAVLAAGVFLLIAAPWYVLVTQQNGFDYLHRFFIGENLERFATAKYNEPRPFWYYVPIVWAALLPWSPFMLLWVRPLAALIRRQRSITHLDRQLLLWAAVPLVVLTISIGKQPRYMLPCLPPLAILLARSIWTRTTETRSESKDVLLLVGGISAGAIMIVLAWFIHRAGPVLSIVNPAFSESVLIAIGLAGLALIGVTMMKKQWLPAAVALTGAMTLLLGYRAVMMIQRPEPVEVMAQTAQAGGQADHLCTCGAFGRNLSFYARRMTVMEDYDEGVRDILNGSGWTLAAIDSEVLARTETTLGRRFRRLADVRYLNTALLRVDMFLNPDPASQLQHVLLITNR
jgi:4-amino-4-deoxy-L-arabinose transferase-like glycosyltransferase